MLAAVAVAAAAGAMPGSAATSNIIVTANVPSATTLTTTGCPPQDPTRTNLGLVTPGSYAITSDDCNVVFGSSNDTATLRTYQPDNRGTSMASSATTLTMSGSSNRMLDVDMATSNIGWAVGEGSANQRLYKTTDGGDSWVAVTVDWVLAWSDNTVDSEVIEGVMLSTTLVYPATTAGSNQGLIKTTDGTNVASTTPSAAVFRDVDSYDGVHVAGASTAGTVHVSADGGATWTIRTPIVDGPLRAIDYDATGTIVYGTLHGTMVRSTDDGATWATVDQDVIGGRVFAIDAVGPRIFATYNGSAIARSHDDGATWLLNSQAGVTNWTGVDGIDAGRMWRVGGPGHVQVSTDGGLTGRRRRAAPRSSCARSTP